MKRMCEVVIALVLIGCGGEDVGTMAEKNPVEVDEPVFAPDSILGHW